MEIIIALIVTDILLVTLVCLCYSGAHRRRVKALEQKNEDMKQYILSLIDLVYYYKNKPDLLLEHLQRNMSIQRLRQFHVVDDCGEPCSGKMKAPEKDKLFQKLLNEGYTTQQLCVIFGMNNLNSVYVRTNRIRKKLDKQDKEHPKEVG